MRDDILPFLGIRIGKSTRFTDIQRGQDRTAIYLENGEPRGSTQAERVDEGRVEEKGGIEEVEGKTEG